MKAMLLVNMLRKQTQTVAELLTFVESSAWFRDYAPWLSGGTRYTAADPISQVVEGVTLRQTGEILSPPMHR